MSEHVLGRVEGRERGPLVVAVGGIHGNEPAGPTAVRRLLAASAGRLRRGRLVGLLGHPRAFARGVRQLDEDLNRVFTPARLAAPGTTVPGTTVPESAEAACAKTLLTALRSEVAAYDPDEVIVVDVHTTSADGGDFVAMGEEPATVALARGFGAPVVLGLAGVLPGTLCGYLDGDASAVGLPGARAPASVRAFGYEAGAHGGPESPARAYGLLRGLLARLGMTTPAALGAPAARTPGDPLRPALSQVVFRLGIPPGGQFTMLPGFRNFDPVQAGQVVAYLDGEPVALERGGYVLMPLYQGVGGDGFFVVRRVE